MANISDFSAHLLSGEPVSLDKYLGKVVLVVNTASKCGFTPQYKGLEDLYNKYKDQGFVVLGFPCNQFGSQEPGSAGEIMTFCERNYGVSFPIFEKINVKGDDTHPLFDWLTREKPGLLGRKIKWNFTKFLIGRDGKPIKRYHSGRPPASIEDDLRKALGL